jgi:hypothetical protein
MRFKLLLDCARVYLSRMHLLNNNHLYQDSYVNYCDLIWFEINVVNDNGLFYFQNIPDVSRFSNFGNDC